MNVKRIRTELKDMFQNHWRFVKHFAFCDRITITATDSVLKCCGITFHTWNLLVFRICRSVKSLYELLCIDCVLRLNALALMCGVFFLCSVQINMLFVATRSTELLNYCGNEFEYSWIVKPDIHVYFLLLQIAWSLKLDSIIFNHVYLTLWTSTF